MIPASSPTSMSMAEPASANAAGRRVAERDFADLLQRATRSRAPDLSSANLRSLDESRRSAIPAPTVSMQSLAASRLSRTPTPSQPLNSLEQSRRNGPALPNGFKPLMPSLRTAGVRHPGGPMQPLANAANSAIGGSREGMSTRDIAAELVATAFIMPAMETMRNSPFKSDLFAPGAAERRFGPMLDREIAGRLTQRQGFSLVDAVAERIRSMGGETGVGT